jgi:hypothetical protein
LCRSVRSLADTTDARSGGLRNGEPTIDLMGRYLPAPSHPVAGGGQGSGAGVPDGVCAEAARTPQQCPVVLVQQG